MTSLASFWSGKDRNRFVLDSQLLQTTLSIFQCIFCVHVYIFVWFVVSPHLGNPEISVFISCLQAEVLSIAHNSLIEVELVSTPFSYRRLFSFFVKISVCFELLPTLSICSSLKWLSIMVSKPLKRISSLLRQSGANGLTKRMYRKSPHIRKLIQSFQLICLSLGVSCLNNAKRQPLVKLLGSPSSLALEHMDCYYEHFYTRWNFYSV